jgi:hypothetical protein
VCAIALVFQCLRKEQGVDTDRAVDLRRFTFSSPHEAQEWAFDAAERDEDAPSELTSVEWAYAVLAAVGMMASMSDSGRALPLRWRESIPLLVVEEDAIRPENPKPAAPDVEVAAGRGGQDGASGRGAALCLTKLCVPPGRPEADVAGLLRETARDLGLPEAQLQLVESMKERRALHAGHGSIFAVSDTHAGFLFGTFVAIGRAAWLAAAVFEGCVLSRYSCHSSDSNRSR